MIWTESEREELRGLYGLSRDSVSRIARLLDRSEYSIRSEATRLGLQPWLPRVGDAVVDEIKNLSGSMPDREIAERVGCSESTVGRIRRKFGIASGWKKYDWDVLGPVIESNWSSMTDQQLGEMLGIHWSSVRDYRHRNGLIGSRGWRRDYAGA